MQTTPTKRQLQKRNTRQRIMASALELIKRNGYANVKIEDICKMCGISKGAFYVHFRSKLDLLKNQYAGGWERRVNERLLDDSASIPEQLAMLMQQRIEYTVDMGYELVQLAMQGILESAESDFYGLNRMPVTPYNVLIKTGQENGEFRSNMRTEDLGHMLGCFITGLIYVWCSSKGSRDLVRESNMLIPIMVDSIRAK